MDDFREGLGEAWSTTAEILPKLIAFLVILIVGYFIAKAISKIVDRVLERVGFDRAIERGGVGRALEQSKYDPSTLVAKVVLYAAMLFVLQLAFGVFGPNPVSDLIYGVIAYLPNVFVAILIVVVGAAISSGVRDIVQGALGGLSYGRAIATAAAVAIMVITVFAALDQLNIAQNIVVGLWYAILAVIVGSAIVAIGGGGIATARRYWERMADRADAEAGTFRSEIRARRAPTVASEPSPSSTVDVRDDPARTGRPQTA